MLEFNWGLLFTVINLLVLYFLVKRFLFKPINNILLQRQELVDKQLAEANAQKEQALELKSTYETSLQAAQEERDQTIQDAKQQAYAEYEKILKDAKTEADALILEAKTSAEQEQKKILRQAGTELSSMVLAATSKILAQQSSPEVNLALYDEFLAKVGDHSEAKKQ